MPAESLLVHELHVERVLGRKVHDAGGKKVGRIEEMIVETVDGEDVVTEFHLGSGALFERIGAFMVELPIFRLIPYRRPVRRYSWRDLDFTVPSRPCLRAGARALP